MQTALDLNWKRCCYYTSPKSFLITIGNLLLVLGFNLSSSRKSPLTSLPSLLVM